MSYTNVDIANATEYANQRLQLHIIKYLHTKYPHIISHLDWHVRAATDDDYFIPTGFKRGIVTTTSVSETLCSQMACNTAKPDGTACTPKDTPTVVNVGTTSYDHICQPACFMLKPVLNENGMPVTQSLNLIWNPKINKCAFVPSSSAWFNHPIYRSDKRYETRVNNLPIGFDRIQSTSSSSSGYSYKYNKPYCDAFFDGFDGTTCTTTIWEDILYAVVGEQIVKLVKTGVNVINTGSVIPPYTGPLAPLPSVDTIPNWINRINGNFKIPDPNMDVSRSRSTRGTVDTPLLPTDTVRRKVLNFMKNNDRFKGIRTSDDSTLDLASIVESIIAGLADPSFWAFLGIGVLSDVILDGIKNICKQFAEKLIPKITASLLKLVGQIGKRLAMAGFRAVFLQAMSKTVVLAVSRAATAIAETLASAATGIGIILLVVGVFDLILTFWDPLNFNSKYPPEIFNEILSADEQASKIAFSRAELVLNMDILQSLLLDQTESIDLYVASFEWMLEYLTALTTNSDGVPLDHDDVLTGIDTTTADKIIKTVHLYTIPDFIKYENDFKTRIYVLNGVKRYIPFLIGGLILSTTVSKGLGLLVAIIVLVVITGFYFTVFTDKSLWRWMEPLFVNHPV